MKFSRNRFLLFEFQISHLAHSLVAIKCQFNDDNLAELGSARRNRGAILESSKRGRYFRRSDYNSRIRSPVAAGRGE